MISLWHTALYNPLYNALVFLIGAMPWASVGLAVIILTIIVRFVIFPFAHKSIKTQRKMRELEPELQKIREKYKDKQEQAKQTMELYKLHGTNPFSGCVTVLIQLPVLIALFLVFRDGFAENAGILYPFVHYPGTISTHFFGIDLGSKSYIMAALVGITQYFYTTLSLPKPSPGSGGKTFQEEFARSMNMQMRYIFPVIFVFFSLSIPSAVALYWVTTNLFSIGQELFVRYLAGRGSPDVQQSTI
ncbi:MAG: YidC/Oxa1 family membrane protein insertase [Candidatus Paceibacterota bacterium]|jgi:YidC/Oxa1 family membrane protein insertase